MTGKVTGGVNICVRPSAPSVESLVRRGSQFISQRLTGAHSTQTKREQLSPSDNGVMGAVRESEFYFVYICQYLRASEKQ